MAITDTAAARTTIATDPIVGVFVEGQAALPVHPGCAPVGVPIVGYLRASENEQGDERCARRGCGRDLA